MARPRKDSVLITWLGEDGLYENGAGPSVNTWNGIRFRKGEAVRVSDAQMIAKAKTNQFYKVEGQIEEPEAVDG